MDKPNVLCRHCGHSWFHDGEIPLFCINCYSRDVGEVPSKLGRRVEALREKMRKEKRKKEKMKGVTKLK